MRRINFIVALFVLWAVPMTVFAGSASPADNAAAPAKWILVRPSQEKWQKGPTSLWPGAQMAILEGDPNQLGFFTMRLKMPDGYKVYPHWHPMTERLTVISGTVNLGVGDKFDPKATTPLTAGTYSSMAPKMAHYAWIKGESILQLSSIGPWKVVYVNPGDDPRNHTK
ncbi:MAG: cupin domain-containing protein [Gemmataceae bacterium]